MKVALLVLFIGLSAFAADAPKTEIKSTPKPTLTAEQQSKLQANAIRQLQLQLQLKQVEQDYFQLNNKLQAAQNDFAVAKEQILKDAGIDSKKYDVQFDGLGAISLTEKK